MTLAYRPTPIDWSQLATMGQNIGGALGQHNLGTAMKGAIGPDGSYDYNKMISVLAGRNPMAAAKLATDAMQAEALADYRDATLGLRVAEANKPPEPTAAQRDAQYFSQLPPGDPQLKYAPRGNAKPLNRQVVNDLATKGELAFKTKQFGETFKDGYGGYGASSLGDAANFAARNLGVGNTEAATWWQDYQRHKNVVRNQLFGSALTATEAAQWERSDINPGMTDDAIRENLKIQEAAAERAARKLARVYMRQGADQELVEEALGISMDDLDSPNVVTTVDVPPPEAPTQASSGPRKTKSGVSWSVD